MPATADHPSAAQLPEPVTARLPITLGQYLKLAGITATGGEAKYLIVSGQVVVNGVKETRRGRHLEVGDTVGVAGKTTTVVAGPTAETSPPA